MPQGIGPAKDSLTHETTGWSSPRRQDEEQFHLFTGGSPTDPPLGRVRASRLEAGLQPVSVGISAPWEDEPPISSADPSLRSGPLQGEATVCDHSAFELGCPSLSVDRPTRRLYRADLNRTLARRLPVRLRRRGSVSLTPCFAIRNTYFRQTDIFIWLDRPHERYGSRELWAECPTYPR